MCDLEYRPKRLVFLFAIVRRILRVFHLVRKLEKSVFNVVEAIWWRLAVASASDHRHDYVFIPRFEVEARFRDRIPQLLWKVGR
jgi:predicted ferric reductase